VRSLAALPGERKLALLGLMAELGDRSESEHRRIALVAEELGIEVVGYATGLYGEAHVTGVDEAVALLRTMGPSDAALVKGSRVARLEEVVRAYGEAEGAPSLTAGAGAGAGAPRGFPTPPHPRSSITMGSSWQIFVPMPSCSPLGATSRAGACRRHIENRIRAGNTTLP
jgi:hypothetical protein